MRREVAWFVLGLAVSVGCSSAGGGPEQAAAGPEGAAREAARAQPTTRSDQAAAPVAAEQHASSAPQFREVTIPAGTALQVSLETGVSSDESAVEDIVRAKLNKAIAIDGTTLVPAGAALVGTVLEANQSGRVKGRASVAFRFDHLQVGGKTHVIRTPRIEREAEGTKSEDAKKIGIGAGAGALIGAVAGGKKGAAVGGAVGAGAGTGVVIATRGQEVRLAVGALLKTTLAEPLTIVVPVD